jgi:hypothetical protein
MPVQIRRGSSAPKGGSRDSGADEARRIGDGPGTGGAQRLREAELHRRKAGSADSGRMARPVGREAHTSTSAYSPLSVIPKASLASATAASISASPM